MVIGVGEILHFIWDSGGSIRSVDGRLDYDGPPLGEDMREAIRYRRPTLVRTLELLAEGEPGVFGVGLPGWVPNGALATCIHCGKMTSWINPKGRPEHPLCCGGLTAQKPAAKARLGLPKRAYWDWGKGWVVPEVFERPFASIDFETANHDRASACAVAVTVCENGEVVSQYDSLIRPSRERCRFAFTHIHGLRWDDVSGAPLFDAVYREMGPVLDGMAFIVAHHSPFDAAVLRDLCAKYSLVPPGMPWYCTVHLARKVWNIFPTGLSRVCEHLKIPLNHHDHRSDSYACAKIVLAAGRTTKGRHLLERFVSDPVSAVGQGKFDGMNARKR